MLTVYLVHKTTELMVMDWKLAYKHSVIGLLD